MKAKKLLLAAMLIVGSAPVMAQATLEDAVKAVKSDVTVKEKENVAKQALKAYKKDAKAICTVGKAYLEVKDFDMARKYAEMAVKANKNAADGYILRGMIEEQNDNPGAAAQEYQSAMYFEPSNPESYKKYAYIYRGSDPNQAVEYLQKIRDIDPSYPVDAEAGHIYYWAAKAKGGDYMKKALASYQKVDKSKLDNSYLTEYALVAFASGKFDLSKEIAVYGLKAQPRNAGYNRLGLYNSVELKQFPEALDYADRLINKSDSVELSSNDYKYCALACTGAEKFDEAVSYYKKQMDVTADADAKNAVMKEIANVYKLKGDQAAAVEAYSEFMSKNAKATATDYTGWANMYRLAATDKQGAEQEADVNKALAIYKEMVEKFPTSADFANFMSARTVSMLDPTQEQGLALPYYQALFESINAAGVKDKSDKARIVESCTYIGVYYFKIKDDSVTAKPYFEKLQEVDPENALAKQVLETYE